MERITGKITLREIFLLYWEAYRLWHTGKIRDIVIENVNKILKCRTPLLGYHMYECKQCSNVRLIPHSCKSRFYSQYYCIFKGVRELASLGCNSCGKIMTDKWTEARLSDVLDVDYHHLVFTVPWQLRSITLANPNIMLSLMFKSVSISLQSWTKKYGGYIPGIYCIVHTFGSDIKYHPHFHVIITAGGLNIDRKKWIDTTGDYLMPEKGLKKRFRHNVIKLLIKANDKGILTMPYLKNKGCYINLRGVVSIISRIMWYIYIGARLLELEVSIKYIGRYTKKPVIAETRIVSCTDKWITILFKDYNSGGAIKSKPMRIYTFITYLTNHIPEKFFRLIRAYGLFSNRLRGKLLPITRKALNQKKSIKPVFKTWRERTKNREKKDPLICEVCNIEMILIFVCFTYNYKMAEKLGLKFDELIPLRQIKINTS